MNLNFKKCIFISTLFIMIYCVYLPVYAIDKDNYETVYSQDEVKAETKLKREVPSVRMFPSLIPSFPTLSLDFLRRKKTPEKIEEQVQEAIDSADKVIKDSIGAVEEPKEEQIPEVVEKINTYSDYKAGLFKEEEAGVFVQVDKEAIENIQEPEKLSVVEETPAVQVLNTSTEENIVEVAQVEKEPAVDVVASDVMKEPVIEEVEEVATDEVAPEVIEATIAHNEGIYKQAWRWFKGKPVENSIEIEMLSKHFLTDTNYNEENHLTGINIKGYTFGHLINSYDNNTFFVGFNRYVARKHFTDNFNIDLRYKAVIFTGYKDKYPNLGGMTPVILPHIGFNYKKVALDMLLIPSDTPIICFSSRITLPDFKKNTAEAPQL